MAKVTTRMRQVVDWRAAVWAGIIGGALFFILQMILVPLFTVGSPWVMSRRIAAMVLGPGVLPPPDTFNLGIVLLALVIHFILSILYAVILAIIIHRWGLLVGIVGGGLFGLALYAINYYTFSAFFPWFFPVRSWLDIVSHVVFGALAGGIYEGLEVETYVPA